ncbi:MAG: winged helix-turn-helix transcriptional regulator [Flavobacteriaceae bacterium]|nr:Lrp/AsnC ligand binding domain-containing protein [Pelagibacterales bacterium]MBT4708670.1 winged helix-turn-helix transcriptional regulator [Flavobacteriaceae bacterium]MBT4959551.1 winged helix-turn-helix transcriptional regulator [Flavobacteriaceae bacterium]
MLKIDGLDKQILIELTSNSRTPILEISRKIGISGAAIHQRIRKLNDSGLIAGHQLKINPKVLGYSTLAFIGVYFDKAERNSEAIKKMKKIPEILECHYTTGNWSVLVKVICKNNEHLMTLLNKQIQSIDGVSRTETFISLEQQIDRQISIN